MEFDRPTDLDTALQLAAESPSAALLAGGTDLMVEMNFSRDNPGHVIALRRIEELSHWNHNRIGAGVTYTAMQTGPIPALAQAARTVGGPQIRNAGTLGGNLGTASPAGDTLPVLAALDADVELRSSTSRRSLRWNDFITGVKQTARRPGEIISAAIVPKEMPPSQAFAKIGVRNAMVISMVSACVMRWADGRTTIALGAVGPTPVRATAAEQMISAESDPSAAAIDEFARIVTQEVRPITDHRGTEAYRRHAAGVLAKRLLERCLAA